MNVVHAADAATAKIQAVARLNRSELRAVRLWDGERVIEVKRPARTVPATQPADADDRAARMITMKAEGQTYRAIAEAFGVSIDRVRQIMARAQSRARMHDTEPNRAALSVRAQNVLSMLIDQPEADRSERDRLLPGRVAALTRIEIRNAPNAGPQTIAEIEAWLWQRGLCLSNHP